MSETCTGLPERYDRLAMGDGIKAANTLAPYERDGIAKIVYEECCRAFAGPTFLAAVKRAMQEIEDERASEIVNASNPAGCTLCDCYTVMLGPWHRTDCPNWRQSAQ